MSRQAFVTILWCLSLHRIVGWCHAGSIRPKAYQYQRGRQDVSAFYEDGNSLCFRNSLHRSKQTLQKQKQLHTSTSSRSSTSLLATTTMLRGGSGMLGSLTAVPVVTLTAQLSSLYLLLNGAALVLFPHKVMLDLYGIETDTTETDTKEQEKTEDIAPSSLSADTVAPSSLASDTKEPTVSSGKFNLYLVRAMGAMSIGMAINLFSTMVMEIPVHQSIGYGLLPRLLFIAASFLFRTFEAVGMKKKYLQANSLGMAWSCVSLMTGIGKPVEAAKGFASVALAKAVFLLVKPIEATNQYFGVDVSGEGMEKSRALCRALGDWLAKSAVLMGLLMFEKDPAIAAGFTCLLAALLEWDKGFLSKTYTIAGAKTPVVQCVNIALALLFAAGFLWEDGATIVNSL
jgi:hypothetical protein